MPSYDYIAIDPSGKKTKGSIDAENLRAARQRLRGQGIYPTEIKEGIKAAAGGKTRDIKLLLKSNDINVQILSVLTRQLATLIGAGLPLVSALHALVDQTDSAAAKRILVDIREKVEEGSQLHKALANFPKSFPRLYINMIASGEASGSLDAVLENLAEYLESQLELRRKIRSALFYPVMMLLLCTAVVVGLVMFVVPMIVEIFEKQGAALPPLTQIVIAISNFLVFYYGWLLLIGGVALVVLAVGRYRATEKGRERFDDWLFRLPVVGNLYQKVQTARISRSLGTLIGSGVGLLNALDIVKNITSNVHLQRALEQARDGVREGRSLGKELARSGRFPSLLSNMISVGESSGQMENMLDRAGKNFENEANALLAGLSTLIEPVMIIVVGVIVLIIVLSVLMPMMDLITVIGG